MRAPKPASGGGRPKLLIVGPAKAADNNGNWRTAQRWARHLSSRWQVALVDGVAPQDRRHAQALIALHARRSAAAVRQWAAGGPGGLVVVLTGTDLYRDIAQDADAQASLRHADRLVVLNEHGRLDLPEEYRAKTRCIFQSAAAHAPMARTSRWLRVLMVGHLRSEKSPETLFAAVRLLAGRPDIRIDHIGGALDAGLAAQALALQQAFPNYRYLGALPHHRTLARIRQAHLLVHASRMEGGANVILEAVRNGTPVLASRIAGNVGMLGERYSGYFEWGDAAALRSLLEACRAGQSHADGFLASLWSQCERRAHLFDPERERAALLELLDECTDSE